MKTLGRQLRQHAVGLLALVVAFSGTAYAANKIGAQDIQRNAIRSPHIKTGQVKRADLARSLRRQIAHNTAPSPSDQLQIVAVNGAPLVLPSGGYGGAPIAQCPDGYVVVGTGFNGPFDVVGGFVLAYGTFVGGFFENDSLITLEGYVQAICARNSAGGATASKAAALRKFRRDVAQATARH